MSIFTAVLIAFVLDIVLGDPEWMPHPVVLMGKVISKLSERFRNKKPPTPEGERRAGLYLAIVVPLLTALVTGGLCFLAYKVHILLFLALETIWCWQCLAGKGLRDAAEDVFGALIYGDLDGARQAVSKLVGRDTEALSEEGVTKAAIESVAENSSDGVLAPLFYMLIGGAPLAMVYKSINTMDSMVGYHNEEFEHFGRAAARLDDAANWIPARIAGWLWILAAGMTKDCSRSEARRIWKRDRNKTESPNAGQTEAPCAGALGVQLGGPAPYFGALVDKPFLGDDRREVEPEDIRLAVKCQVKTAYLALVFGLLLRLLLLILFSAL